MSPREPCQDNSEQIDFMGFDGAIHEAATAKPAQDFVDLERDLDHNRDGIVIAKPVTLDPAASLQFG